MIEIVLRSIIIIAVSKVPVDPGMLQPPSAECYRSLRGDAIGTRRAVPGKPVSKYRQPF
jgi:hypothetical protein